MSPIPGGVAERNGTCQRKARGVGPLGGGAGKTQFRAE